MKKLLAILSLLALTPMTANAALYGVGNPPVVYTSPDTQATLTAAVCEDFNRIIDGNTGINYIQSNCAGTATYTQTYPLPQVGVVGLAATFATKFDVPTGTTSQVVRGDGTLGTGVTLPITQSDVTGLTSSLSNSLSRANHTGSQAESTVTNLTTDLSNRVTAYSGSTQKANAKILSKHATASSGTVVFYLTDNELVGGNALCPNMVWEDSIQIYVNNAAASYQWSEAVTNSNKTLTVTINKLTTSNILTGILGQAAVNAEVVRLTVICD